MKNNEKMIIGKFLLIFGLLMQILGMIPNCAHAQAYEEAERNDAIINELMYEDFRYDADKNLWILEATEDDSEGVNEFKATYNLYYNSGHIDMKYYKYGDTTLITSLAAEGTLDFKWFEDEEEFGIVDLHVKGYEYIGDAIWLF